MRVYLVGGAVRDALLGLPVSERDWVVVGASPEAMEARGFERADAAFPVYLHPVTGEEFALARRETKRGPGHKGFAVEAGPDVTLDEDLARRDLRVNAIARDAGGEHVDPFDGLDDLEARRLRHVTDAFVDDPLRVLRAARFAAQLAPSGFRIDPATVDLMRRATGRGELATLGPERIWRETGRALDSEAPERYFEALASCGALAAVFPELAGAVPARLEALADCRRAGGSAAACLAAAALLPGAAGADATSAAQSLPERLRAPREFREVGQTAARVASHVAAADTTAPSITTLLASADAYRRPERFGEAMLACRAALRRDGDGTRRLDALERAWHAAAAVSAATLVASGWSGAALGEELARRRHDAVVESLRG